MTRGSYDVQDSHRDTESEVARLRVQAAATWTKEMRNLGVFGLCDGMSVLEVGSGPGYITEQLCQSLPASRITGVEIDPLLAEQASALLAEHGTDRVHIMNASMTETGLPDDQFDFAIARLIFQHLPDPDAAAREILRLLKPGGRLVIIDSDDGIWGVSDPGIPEMEAALSTYGSIQAAQGGNRLVGRTLLRLLDRAGFVKLDLEAIVTHSDLLGLDALLPQLDPDRLLPLVLSGAMEKTAFEALQSSYRRFTDAADPLLMMVLLMACGEKR